MTANPNVITREREDAARSAMLREWGLDRPRGSVVDISTRRPPLGLAPVIEPGDEPERDASYDDRHGVGERLAQQAIDNLGGEEACRQYPATIWDVLYNLGVASQISLDGDDSLYSVILKQRAQITSLETELARERAAVAELRATQHEHAFILERLKIEGKGPPGERGLMGRDGHDGPRGERGARGADGRAGAPGPRIIGWETTDELFTAVPLLSDGRKGAALHLRGMFEQYHAQVDAEDAAEEVDAAQASRAAVEREVERVRAGLPR